MKAPQLLWGLPALLLFGLVPAPARADDNRPLTVLIEGEPADSYRVSWKVPVNIEARHVPALTAAGTCTSVGKQRNWSDPLGHWREETWRCPQGLAGATIGIRYPFANPNLAAIIRYRPAGEAEPQTMLLQPQDGGFSLAAPGEVGGSFTDFLVLGVEHIWIGFDHLLFVAGLIFIAGTLRRVAATITGFTVAHSITLALAALGWVRLPIAAIEAAIALSIVFLAVEVVKGPRDTLTWRKPIVVASAFGLLHGFGFAAVLAEIGLPREGLVAALLAFNLGIEVGQVIFAAAVLLILHFLRKVPAQFGQRIPISRLAGYSVGILASYWLIERLP